MFRVNAILGFYFWLYRGMNPRQQGRMGRKPSDPRGEVAQEVERQHANAEPPPGSFRQNALIHFAAVVGDLAIEIIPQRLVEFTVVNHQVGFQIE